MICLTIKNGDGFTTTAWYDLILEDIPYALVPNPKVGETLPELRLYLEPQKIFPLPTRQERHGYQGVLLYSDIEVRET